MSSLIQKLIPLINKYFFQVATIIFWSIITIGIIARIALYIANPTLWLDEAALTLNILDFDFFELLRTDRFSQSAPFAYLLIEKFLTSFIGIQEYILRLPAFFAGLLSLYLLYRLFETFEIKNKLLLAFYAVLPVAITYSVQHKQYMIELAISSLLLLLTQKHLKHPTSTTLLQLTISGIIALLFSQTSLFMLAACGITLFIDAITTQKLKIYDTIRELFIPGILWLTTFSILYLIQYKFTSGNEHLHQYWQNSKAFLSLGDLETFKQLYLSIFSFSYSFGKIAPFLLSLVLIGGYAFNFISMKSFYTKVRIPLILITLTFVISAIASALGLYPLQGRLTIFLIPSTLLLFGLLLREESHFFVRITVSSAIAGLTVLLIATLRYFPVRYVVVGETYGFQRNIETVAELSPTDYAIYFVDGNPTMEYYRRRYPKLQQFSSYSFVATNQSWQIELQERMKEKKFVFLFPYKISDWQTEIDYISQQQGVTCSTADHFMCIQR